MTEGDLGAVDTEVTSVPVRVTSGAEAADRVMDFIEGAEERSYLRLVEQDLRGLRMSVPEKLDARKVKQAVVVPAYRELENGNAARLLESFTDQTDIGDDKVLVLAINNQPQDEVGGEENVRLYRTIQWINGEKGATLRGVPEETRAVARRMKELGMQIVGIDMFSKGYIKDMARIRTILTATGYALAQHPDEGQVIWCDADSLITNRALTELMTYQAMGAEATFRRLEYYFDDDERVMRSGYEYQFGMMRNYCENFLSPRQERHVGGPLIAASRDTFMKALQQFKETDRLRVSGQAEDFVMSNLLYQTAEKAMYIPGSKVFTADRARPEGFDAAIRESRLTDPIGESKWQSFQIRLAKQMLGELRDRARLEERPVTYGRVIEVLDACGLEIDKQEWKRAANELGQYDDAEVIGEGKDVPLMTENHLWEYFKQRGSDMVTAQDYVRGMVAICEARFSPAEMDILRRELGDKGIQEREIVNGFVAGLRERWSKGDWGKWEFMKQYYREGMSLQEFLETMEVEFPALFSTNGESEQVMLRRATFSLKGVLDALYAIGNLDRQQAPGLESIRRDRGQ